MKNFSSSQLDILKSNGIIPVLTIKNRQELDTILEAGVKAGLNCMEIMLRHPYALEAISIVKQNHPDIIVGAGTVMTMDNLKDAVSAGADFCVAPGCDDALVTKSLEMDTFFLPGCVTPTEITHAASLGIDIVKFFPSEAYGGTATLKLYEGALSQFSFVPTGGITLKNLPDYLERKNVLACGGSYMAPKDLLASGNSEAIYNIIADCVKIRKGE